MKRLLVHFFVLFSLVFMNHSFACTTAIVSGKYTVDGRPLLFKHRDTGSLQNKIMYFKDGKYEYLGLVNSKDKEGKEVWAGYNSAGFAIMNSADYNLNLQDTTKLKDREGLVMKMALQSCATLEDFENLLKELPKPMGVDANFGVIDAQGGAAYFETSNYTFTKFDANDTKTAPFGYIIRTNFAFTGAREEEYGLIRYQNAEDLFHLAANTQSLSHQFILEKVTRSLKHSLTKTDLTVIPPTNTADTRYVNFNDFIPRYSSAASVVVQGVRPGEPANLSTMWTVLGFQLSSVVVPTWLAGGEKIPEILSVNKKGIAPLCDKALTLKKQVFPLTKGSYKNYINLAAVYNQDESGILQKLKPLEEKILNETDVHLDKWRSSGAKNSDIQKFYNWLDKTVLDYYQAEFGL